MIYWLISTTKNTLFPYSGVNVGHVSVCSYRPVDNPTLEIRSPFLYRKFIQGPPAATRGWVWPKQIWLLCLFTVFEYVVMWHFHKNIV